MLRSAHLDVPSDIICIFSYEYPSETAKSNRAVKVIGESVRCADLTIRLIVKANSMSARIYNIVVIVIPVLGHIQLSVISNIVVSVNWPIVNPV